jgi:hypothetical protein
MVEYGHKYTLVLWPPSLLSNVYQVLSSEGVNSRGLEVDHSPPSKAEVNIAWSYTSISSYVFMA